MSIAYNCSYIRSCILKTKHGGLGAMDGRAYFVSAVSYAFKKFMKSTNGGQNIDTHKHTHTHMDMCV
jgi:hypothetical protein